MVPNHLMDKLSQVLLDLHDKVKLPDNNETILDALQKNDPRLTGKLTTCGKLL